MQTLDFTGDGEGSLLDVTPSISSSSRLGSGGGMCGLLNAAQNLEDHKNKYS